MNKMEVLTRLLELGEAFTIQEAIDHLKINRNLMKYYLKVLSEAGFIKRIGKGIYAITLDPNEPPSVHEFVLASLFVKPSAIAYWSALNYYGLTEQIPNITFVQTPRKRGYEKIVKFNNRKFKIVTVKPSKFFGLNTVKIGRRKVNITDPEKTIVDCLDKPRYCGGIIEVVKALKNASFNQKKLLEYAQKMENKTILKRLGYISERLGLGLEEKIQLSDKDRKSFSLLDPTMPARGKFDYKWGLLVNVPEDYWEELEW
ncbi:hypothetical protein E3E31_12240 [Thermococcus sp. M39]|uniref:type IV toxin-antitoxin system AbiEi family antitoxin domain-containing protein n=1 Tax=unclassified Thermococcus TaxID=2627626 RepID=UPI001438B51F|nr:MULTISPECIES: type IV toxin-antitoxin system AbiEi family antitoxin [unclassified Thermococcus]NJE09278.1 hypothetical protein [Thermococcus sp. M39]NJE12825.1 hypothetical protein [Thermococcus sp. LS2]